MEDHSCSYRSTLGGGVTLTRPTPARPVRAIQGSTVGRQISAVGMGMSYKPCVDVHCNTNMASKRPRGVSFSTTTMADPPSLVSLVSGLIGTGTEISFRLHQLVGSDTRGLAAELTDLCSVLRELEKSLGNGNGLRCHEGLWLGFADVLASCVERFGQVRVLLKEREINGRDGTRRSRPWEKEVELLRAQLEAHKAVLNITLLLCTQ